METPISLFFFEGLQTIERLSGVFDVPLESILINSGIGLDYCACKPKGNTTMIIIINSSSSSPPPSPPSSSSSSSSRHHHHHQQQQHHHYTCMFPSSALLFLHDHLVFLHHSALLHMIAQVADEKRKEIEVRKTTLPARQLIQHTVLSTSSDGCLIFSGVNSKFDGFESSFCSLK